MNIKEAMLINAGVEKVSELCEDDIYLTEGLVFFKNSKRLKNLARKMEKRKVSVKMLSPKNRIDLQRVIDKINIVANKFELVETQFKAAKAIKDKEAAKKVAMKYKELKAEYINLIKAINKESVKKALKVAGIAGLAAAALYFGITFITQTGVFAANLAKAKTAVGKGASTLQQKLDKPVYGGKIARKAEIEGSLFGKWTSGEELQKINQDIKNINIAAIGTAAAGGIGGGLLVGKILKSLKRFFVGQKGPNPELTRRTSDAIKSLEKTAVKA